MKRKLMSFISVLTVFFFISSCASTPRTRYREGDNTGQKINITVKDEEALTSEVLAQMKKDYPPLDNPRLQAYISSIGQRLVNANNLHVKPYKYSFTVVDVGYVNAFALPAGTVFVTLPLIVMTETEAELAGVLGHEMGHIIARHTAERMYRAKKDSKKNLLITAGAGVVGAAVGFGVGKMVCKKGDTECLAKAAGGGLLAGAGGSLLVQKYHFMANSREDEMEADRIGFRVSTKAGFCKDNVGKFYKKLLEMEKKHGHDQNKVMQALSDAMSTHPPSKNRVKQMNELSSSSQQDKNKIVSSKEYYEIKRMAQSIMEAKKKK